MSVSCFFLVFLLSKSVALTSATQWRVPLVKVDWPRLPGAATVKLVINPC